MDKLVTLLTEYAYNPEDVEVNYALAVAYEEIKQLAASISFYMRTAERTYETDVDLAYLCLMKIALQLEIQGKRNATAVIYYKHAININPQRPEAYYLLSKLLEVNGQYIDCYVFANLGLTYVNDNLQPLRQDVGCQKYRLLFEKAVSGWHWGKGIESRLILQDLLINYDMDDYYSQLVKNNIQFLGIGPRDVSFVEYFKHKHDRLRFKFPGSENIVRNYSQIYQDLFVLAAHKGKRNGLFLEIGCYTPWEGNNTALLETEYGWNGISIDIKPENIAEYQRIRKSTSICADATKIDYKKLLKSYGKGNIYDYLQIDCEPSHVTFEILLAMPFDEYKFAIVTYEHDDFVDVTKTYRSKSRKYLELMGYKMMVNDASPTNYAPFEDWWYHPDLIDEDTVSRMQSIKNGINQIEDYMLIGDK